MKKNMQVALGAFLTAGMILGGATSVFASTTNHAVTVKAATAPSPRIIMKTRMLGGRGFINLSDVATILGIDKTTLQSDLKAGQSLASIAQAKGISETTLVSDLQADLQTQLNQAVSSGKLTSAQEQQILSNFSARAAKLVEQPMPPRGGVPGGHGPIMFRVNLDVVATILGIDKTTLQSDLKAGQSLASIAQAKGISETTLVSDLQADLQTQLNQAVSSGKLTSAQEQQILSNFSAHAAKLVEQPMPTNGRFEPGFGGLFHGGKPVANGPAFVTTSSSADSGISN